MKDELFLTVSYKKYKQNCYKKEGGINFMAQELNRYGVLNSLISILNEGEEYSSDAVIAKYLLQNFNHLQNLNIYDMADECFVSRATIRRFAQRLGFDNFKILKNQFESFHDTYSFYRAGIYDNTENNTISEQILKMVNECDSFFTDEKIAGIVNDIKKANTIVFLTSDIYSRQSSEFQKAMILNDKMVRIISKKYENSELLHSLKSTDLLLVISVSGFFVNVILPYIKDNQAKTILLTTVHDLKYYDYFDEVWYLSKSAKTNNRSVYTVFATQYCLEKIFDAYMKSLN
mgnify:FL=1